MESEKEIQPLYFLKYVKKNEERIQGRSGGSIDTDTVLFKINKNTNDQGTHEITDDNYYFTHNYYDFPPCTDRIF